MKDELSDTLLEKLKKYHYGEQQATSSKQLEVAFSISNRQVRHLISALRRENEPICSSDRGYFYSKDPKEIQRCIRQLNRRAVEIERVKSGLEVALEEIKGA